LTPLAGEPARGLGPDAPQRVRRPVAEHLEPRLVGEPERPRRLAEAGRQLGLQLVLPDPDRALEPGARADPVVDLLGKRLRVVGVDAEESLVPPEHLDHGVQLPQRRHHLG